MVQTLRSKCIRNEWESEERMDGKRGTTTFAFDDDNSEKERTLRQTGEPTDGERTDEQTTNERTHKWPRIPGYEYDFLLSFPGF